MEVLFLGTGNAFHSGSRLSQSIVIRTADFTWCIDAGPTFLYQLEKFKVDPVTVEQIFFTHFHGDHIAGIPFFMLHLYEFTQDNYAVTINGPVGTTQCCRELYHACFPEIILDTHAHYREFPVKKDTRINLEHNSFLELFPMEHKPESLGYKFTIAGKRIAITGDTRWNPEILRLTNNTDLAIIECTMLQRSRYSHVAFDEFAENLDSIAAGLIVPVHLTDEIAAAFKKLNHPRVRLVADGGSIQLIR